MNEHVKLADGRTTQAAEGLDRWRWTLEEFERLGEQGFLGERDRVELIGGEIVPMSPKGNRHELLRSGIADWFARRLPEDQMVLQEPGWRPDGAQYFEPDILIVPRGPSRLQTRGSEARLLIEVADTSATKDLGLKAQVYAALGVPEYWVVLVEDRAVRVHREPGEAAYNAVTTVGVGDTVLAVGLGLELRIGADIDFDEGEDEA